MSVVIDTIPYIPCVCNYERRPNYIAAARKCIKKSGLTFEEALALMNNVVDIMKDMKPTDVGYLQFKDNRRDYGEVLDAYAAVTEIPHEHFNKTKITIDRGDGGIEQTYVYIPTWRTNNQIWLGDRLSGYFTDVAVAVADQTPSE